MEKAVNSTVLMSPVVRVLSWMVFPGASNFCEAITLVG